MRCGVSLVLFTFVRGSLLWIFYHSIIVNRTHFHPDRDRWFSQPVSHIQMMNANNTVISYRPCLVRWWWCRWESRQEKLWERRKQTHAKCRRWQAFSFAFLHLYPHPPLLAVSCIFTTSTWEFPFLSLPSAVICITHHPNSGKEGEVAMKEEKRGGMSVWFSPINCRCCCWSLFSVCLPLIIRPSSWCPCLLRLVFARLMFDCRFNFRVSTPYWLVCDKSLFSLHGDLFDFSFSMMMDFAYDLTHVSCSVLFLLFPFSHACHVITDWAYSNGDSIPSAGEFMEQLLIQRLIRLLRPHRQENVTTNKLMRNFTVSRQTRESDILLLKLD